MQLLFLQRNSCESICEELTIPVNCTDSPHIWHRIKLHAIQNGPAHWRWIRIESKHGGGSNNSVPVQPRCAFKRTAGVVVRVDKRGCTAGSHIDVELSGGRSGGGVQLCEVDEYKCRVVSFRAGAWQHIIRWEVAGSRDSRLHHGRRRSERFTGYGCVGAQGLDCACGS